MGAGTGLGGEAGKEYAPGHPIIGGLLGGLAGGVGTGLAGKGLEAVRNFASGEVAGRGIGKVLGSGQVPSGAVKRVAKSLQEDMVTPQTAAATQTQLGPETMMMDLGRQLQGRAEQMAVQPGHAQNVVLGAVEGRTGMYGAGTAARFKQTLDQALGQSQNKVELIDRIDRLVQQQAGPAYKSVMDAHPPYFCSS